MPATMDKSVVLPKASTPTALSSARRGHFRMPALTASVAGTGRHRSGWPAVVDALFERQGNTGPLIDHFVEHTFRPRRFRSSGLRAMTDGLRRLAGRPPRAPTTTWREPWLGVFHVPHNFPLWFNPMAAPRRVLEEPTFRASRHHLQGALAFSEYHAAWLREQLRVPVLAVKHPTETTSLPFDWTAFSENPTPRLVQIGYFLRNYRAIYQVPVPSHFRKTHLFLNQPNVRKIKERTDRHSPYRSRPDIGEVDVFSRLPDAEYDALLAQNIIFLELFDASANNTVVEAIDRATPLVVNRHPAVIEYLGPDYPLFYDDITEVPMLLTRVRLHAAHNYLREIDKTEFSIASFVDRLDAFAAKF